MNKLALLFVVLCAVALVSSLPARKHHKKSSKLVRFSPKAAKATRAKLTAVPIKPHRRHRVAAKQQFKECDLAEHGHATSVADAYPEASIELDAPELDIPEEVAFEEPAFVEDELAVVEDEVAVEDEIAYEAPKAAAHAGAQYFNTRFGNTQKGAIALANSYSTGQKGASTSHATAYGKH
jgi:hypothetical protein